MCEYVAELGWRLQLVDGLTIGKVLKVAQAMWRQQEKTADMQSLDKTAKLYGVDKKTVLTTQKKEHAANNHRSNSGT